MITKAIYIELKGDLEERAEEIQTTKWAKYKEKEDFTVVLVPAQRQFMRTAIDIYSQIGEVLNVKYLK